MKFSIIIPTKNEKVNLQKLLPQFDPIKKEFKTEVIVADGASDDGSIEIAGKLADKVEVKTKKGRETIGEGRNRGAKVAGGELLLFLDAGVVVPEPKKFATRVAEVFNNPQIVAASTNVNIDPKIANWQDKLVHGFVNCLVRFWNFMGWGAGKGEVHMIRATAFRKVKGYNEKLPAAEDNDMMRRLAKIGKVVFIKDLQVYDDPRRYRKDGYLLVISKWMLNQFWVRFFGRSWSREWKRVD